MSADAPVYIVMRSWDYEGEWFDKWFHSEADAYAFAEEAKAWKDYESRIVYILREGGEITALHEVRGTDNT